VTGTTSGGIAMIAARSGTGAWRASWVAGACDGAAMVSRWQQQDARRVEFEAGGAACCLESRARGSVAEVGLARAAAGRRQIAFVCRSVHRKYF